jgi:hypothetical protein
MPADEEKADVEIEAAHPSPRRSQSTGRFVVSPAKKDPCKSVA